MQPEISVHKRSAVVGGESARHYNDVGQAPPGAWNADVAPTEERRMTRMLTIGLVWLSISALVGVLIGLAIHRADVRDEQFERRSRALDRARDRALHGPGSPSRGRSSRRRTSAPHNPLSLGGHPPDRRRGAGHEPAPPSSDDGPPGEPPPA